MPLFENLFFLRSSSCSTAIMVVVVVAAACGGTIISPHQKLVSVIKVAGLQMNLLSLKLHALK